MYEWLCSQIYIEIQRLKKQFCHLYMLHGEISIQELVCIDCIIFVYHTTSVRQSSPFLPIKSHTLECINRESISIHLFLYIFYIVGPYTSPCPVPESTSNHLVSDCAFSFSVKFLEHIDVCVRETVMFKRLSYEFTIDWVKRSFEVNEIYAPKDIEFFTILYYTMEWIYSWSMHERFLLNLHWFTLNNLSSPSLSLVNIIIWNSFGTVVRNVIPLLLLQWVRFPFLGMMVAILFLQTLGIFSSLQTISKRSPAMVGVLVHHIWAVH